MASGIPAHEQAPGDARAANDLVLSFPPEPENVSMARLFAASLARHFGCEEDRVEDVKVAVSEAATNAIKAHREASTDEPVTLSITPATHGFAVEVSDRGRGLGSVVDPDRGYTPPEGLFAGSLGLALIRALFPESAIERNADGGTTVRFRVDTT